MPNELFRDLLSQMLEASKEVIGKHWKEVRPYAENEFKALIGNLELILSLKAEGAISEEQAKLYFEIQKNTSRMVLLTIEGLGIIAVEEALNAALNILKSTANTAIGWSIL